MKMKLFLTAVLAAGFISLAGCCTGNNSQNDNYFGYTNETQRAPDPVENAAENTTQSNDAAYNNYSDNSLRSGGSLVDADNIAPADYYGDMAYSDGYDSFYGSHRVRYDVYYHYFSPYYDSYTYSPYYAQSYAQSGFGIYFSFGNAYCYPWYPRVSRYYYDYHPYDYWAWNRSYYPGWNYYPDRYYSPVIYANSTPSTPRTYRRIGVSRGGYGDVGSSSGAAYNNNPRGRSNGSTGSSAIPSNSLTNSNRGTSYSAPNPSRRGGASYNPNSGNTSVRRSSSTYSPSNTNRSSESRPQNGSNQGYRRGGESSPRPSYTPPPTRSSTPQSGTENVRRGNDESRGGSSGGNSGGSSDNSRKRTR